MEVLAWYGIAANNNHAGAEYNIAVMHRNGQGLPVNHSEAFIWFTKAANKGYADA
jgi:TPR repeat protein